MVNGGAGVKHWLMTRRSALLFALAAFLLVMIATMGFGVGITSDGVNALAAAHSIHHGGPLVNYDGTPYVLWPPLQPVVLSLLEALFGSMEGAGRVLNALLFALTVLLVDEWLRPNLRSGWLRLSALAFLALSVPLFNLHVLLLSEPLYIALSLVVMLLFRNYWQAPRVGQLLLMAGVTALATMQRYVGVTLLGAVMLAVLTSPAIGSIRKRWHHSLLFGAVASLPLGAWLFYTRVISGQMGGERFDSASGVGENLWLILERLSSWFLPTTFPALARIILFVAVTAVVVPLVVRWRRRAPQPGEFNADSRLTFFILAGYLLFLWVAASTVAFSQIDDRFLAVILPQSLCFAYFILQELEYRWEGQRVLRTALMVLALLWPAYGAVRVAKYMVQYRTEGIIDYRTVGWINSELIGKIAELDRDVPLISNQPEAIWYYTGHRATFLPHERASVINLPEWEWRLAWFTPNRRPYLLGPDRLELGEQLDTLAVYRDGLLLMVKPTQPEEQDAD